MNNQEYFNKNMQNSIEYDRTIRDLAEEIGSNAAELIVDMIDNRINVLELTLKFMQESEVKKPWWKFWR